ncbi:hypothetical protein OPT61_g7907 [Boeremia exigua]|uniref:Uncharacterized protein n=1 Tax=Boeremia exigua TaxID=749465 RepID=A0ACC2I0B2_9PLEO|nr:hypothetical protein OPT61_g7907 [Boeremia exigua]
MLVQAARVEVQQFLKDGENASTGPIIGIDIGASYSRVGIWRNGEFEIITADQGSRALPSWVAFTDDGHLIGEEAKSQATSNSRRTVFDFGRLVGLEFRDHTIQEATKRFPFKVINERGQPRVSIETAGKEVTFAFEDILSMVLKRLKEIAEDYLNEPVYRAVITVPAQFNDAQRVATKNAGKAAGLDILRALNKPVAAALAYDLDKKNQTEGIFQAFGFDTQWYERQVLVYDLGASTLDVSVITIEEGVFEVQSITSARLGGENFNGRIVTYLAEKLSKASTVDITQDAVSMERLAVEAERAKRILSFQNDTVFEIESSDGVTLSEILTRAQFESLNDDLFEATLKYVRKALEDAKMKESDIDEIVLVGGSTRIPKIEQMVEDLFAKKAQKYINPDEVTVIGAAFQGSRLAMEEHLGPAPRGMLEIEVTFELDPNNVLRVSAIEKTSGRSHSIDIPTSERFTAEDADRIVEEAEKYAEDTANRAQYEARKKLEDFVYSLKRQVASNKGQRMEKDDRDSILDAVKRTEHWLDDHATKADVEDFDAQFQTLADAVDPVVPEATHNGHHDSKTKGSEQDKLYLGGVTQDLVPQMERPATDINQCRSVPCTRTETGGFVSESEAVNDSYISSSIAFGGAYLAKPITRREDDFAQLSEADAVLTRPQDWFVGGDKANPESRRPSTCGEPLSLLHSCGKTCDVNLRLARLSGLPVDDVCFGFDVADSALEHVSRRSITDCVVIEDMILSTLCLQQRLDTLVIVNRQNFNDISQSSSSSYLPAFSNESSFYDPILYPDDTDNMDLSEVQDFVNGSRQPLINHALEDINANATTVQSDTIEAYVEEIYVPGHGQPTPSPTRSPGSRRHTPRKDGFVCTVEDCRKTFNRNFAISKSISVVMRDLTGAQSVARDSSTLRTSFVTNGSTSNKLQPRLHITATLKDAPTLRASLVATTSFGISVANMRV